MDNFLAGFIACIICDGIFAIWNYFVERAFYYRKKRKELINEKPIQ